MDRATKGGQATKCEQYDHISIGPKRVDRTGPKMVERSGPPSVTLLLGP